ncbi:Flowering promoting factor 1 [Hibiscus syriacus]|uniref:Flowering promoting factor 1 n=1 Tax=Hibiscus syriacus TaxID=106335 RepID=A0A6A2XJL0_HIBSY|nr:fasciclin-like arabinogalactan protein 3 [Hibiscus syriacus]KAE8658659.1 Flowering promoting factor 1 [Hibiscus syriacus]
MAVTTNAKSGAYLLFVAAFFLALSTTSTALNITKALADYSEYSTLSNLLKQTKLTEAINHRLTITILALDNDAIKSIANRPNDELREILMNHIILDYFDKEKIRKLGKKSALLTTLYQTTGSASNQNGFVNITRIAPGDVVFGSATKGSPLVAKLLGSVISQPFNLSVLHISTPIVAPAFGDPILPPPPPPGSKPPAPAPKKSKSSSSSAPSSDAEDEADSPSPSDAPAPSPKAAKRKSPPKPKDSDDNDEDSEAPSPSASSRVVWSWVSVAVVIGLIAF